MSSACHNFVSIAPWTRVMVKCCIVRLFYQSLPDSEENTKHSGTFPVETLKALCLIYTHKLHHLAPHLTNNLRLYKPWFRSSCREPWQGLDGAPSQGLSPFGVREMWQFQPVSKPIFSANTCTNTEQATHIWVQQHNILYRVCSSILFLTLGKHFPCRSPCAFIFIHFCDARVINSSYCDIHMCDVRLFYK